MSSCSLIKNDRWIRHHTKNIITNDDARTHLITFNKHKVVFRMSIAKAKYVDNCGDTGDLNALFYWTQDPSVITTLPPSITTVIAFPNNCIDPTTAINNATIPATLQNGNKPYITLGIGATQWSKAYISTIITQINSNVYSKYAGIVFDIENTNGGSGPNDYPATTDFEPMFAAAKSLPVPLTVIVTVSHSGGLWANITNPALQMQAFFTSTNIDYLSPQLYTSGVETANDYDPSNGSYSPTVPWSSWQGCIPKVAPSLVFASYYPSAQATFSNASAGNILGLTAPIPLSGFIQWNNLSSDEPPPSGP